MAVILEEPEADVISFHSIEAQTTEEFATIEDVKQVINMMASVRKEITDIQFRLEENAWGIQNTNEMLNEKATQNQIVQIHK